MIKLKDIIKEIEAEQQPERKLMLKWNTPQGSSDDLINIIHEIMAKIMHKIGSNNELYLAHYIKSVPMEDGTFALWNPSNGITLIYDKNDKTWQLKFPGEMHQRFINDRELRAIIDNWMR